MATILRVATIERERKIENKLMICFIMRNDIIIRR